MDLVGFEFVEQKKNCSPTASAFLSQHKILLLIETKRAECKGSVL